MWIDFRYVCRFRAEESAHAASRRERPQNAPHHRGRPTPWAQERDGYVFTIFHKLNPSNSCPVSALAHGPLCGPGFRFLRCYGYRRVILDGHLRTLGGPGRGVVRPGRYASGARSNCSRPGRTRQGGASPQLTPAAAWTGATTTCDCLRCMQLGRDLAQNI